MSQHPPSPPAATAEEIAHAFEDQVEAVDLSRYSIEDWITQFMFWAMTLAVFVQFFTRYVLNNSLAWTEEVAINFLVGVVFFGSIMCVRLSRHIQVDVLYHYIPAPLARALSLLVDVVRIVFFGYGDVSGLEILRPDQPRTHDHDRPAEIHRLLHGGRGVRADVRAIYPGHDRGHAARLLRP